MKKLAFRLIIVSLFFISCTQENLEVENQQEITKQSSQELLSIEQINAIIDKTLKDTGDFSWMEVSPQVLWSATVHGDYILTIGYGEKGESFRTQKTPSLDNIKNSIIELVMDSEISSKKEILIEDDKILNVIDIQVKSFETIRKLLNIDGIRYLEPNGYSFFANEAFPQNQTRSTLGCGFDSSDLNTNDYRVITPNSYISWTFDQHNIEEAWSHSTGAGITVGLIDTGVSQHQSLLGSNFNDGWSNGRTMEKYGTFIDSWWWWSNNYDGPYDLCGHGTSMASTIAAPRNDDYKPVGVAYNCNMVAYRATEDVVLNDYHERKGVKNALISLANRNDVKIISMSIGYPWSIGNVSDAVQYAYYKQKLIFAAGGTSTALTNWYPVTFPASMSETIAVTGITDNGNYQKCDTCHDGPQIEFTIVMQRNNDNSRTGTVLGYYNGDVDYVGGSSVATATTAGIAALVWSKHPSWSRSQVLNKMRQSSEFYPNKDSTKGYGNIDALQAVQ